MAKDLKIDIDGIRLNIRVGVILRHGKNVLLEISKVGKNSVIPGGRIQINERSSAAIKRELMEEMNFSIDEKRLQMVKVFENFFLYDDKDFHEIYFLYEYTLSDIELASLNLDENYDNAETFFKLIPNSDLAKYNLLPLDLYEIIQKD